MFDRMKEAILSERTRLTPESKFKFACHEKLSCFTDCCGDVNIFLTPYDVLRMRARLQISSTEFLEKYTISLQTDQQKAPLVVLKMNENERKSCQFVSPEGCGIYEDRPWSCRLFPLGMASSKSENGAKGEEFCFLVEENEELGCKGLGEDREWTVAEWFRDQEIDTYEKNCEQYKELSLHEDLQGSEGLTPSKLGVFYLSCYDLDSFRRLIFESTFLHRFEVEDEVIEKLQNDDGALLDFGYKWLMFSLFGEYTIKIRGEVEEDSAEQVDLNPVG